MMNTKPETTHTHFRLTAIGWTVSVIGTALYAYGYFVTGNASMVDWSQYLPKWGVEFVPNVEAELGFALSIIGSIPIYYGELTKRQEN